MGGVSRTSAPAVIRGSGDPLSPSARSTAASSSQRTPSPVPVRRGGSSVATHLNRSPRPASVSWLPVRFLNNFGLGPVPRDAERFGSYDSLTSVGLLILAPAPPVPAQSVEIGEVCGCGVLITKLVRMGIIAEEDANEAWVGVLRGDVLN